MIDILHIFVTIVCSLQNSKRRNMSEPETLNYQETLAIIETFMIKSGLRDFCTTVCQGQCCKHCIKNNSCFENEGKRLPCSLYICRDIKLHLGSTSSKFFKYYLAINTILRKQYHSITRNPDFDDYFYFRPPSNKIIDELKVPKNFYCYSQRSCIPNGQEKD